MNLSALKKRVPFKWKPNNQLGDKFQCVGFLDARQVRDILDEVVGTENWTCDFKEIKGNLYGGIAININGGKLNGDYPAKPEWVWRWDCGTESRKDKDENEKKGEASDAFKRAGVAWGIGAFLYDLGIVKVDVKDYKGKAKPADNKGNILWSMDELGEYIFKQYPHLKPEVEKCTKETPTPSLPNNTKGSTAKDANKSIYNKDKQGTYTNDDFKPAIETVTAVGKLKRDGKTGGQVLCLYLDDYNKKMNKSYKKVKDIVTDKEIMEFVELVNSLPPKEL
jgi:hypothetical protein